MARMYTGRPSASACTVRATNSASCAGRAGAAGVGARQGAAGQAEDVERVFRGDRRHVNHFKARRSIAQQPKRARRVAAGQDETVAAGAEAVHEVVEHPPQAREALEGPQLQELVEQERRVIAAARARPREEAERLIERGAGRRRRSRLDRRERRCAGHRPQKPLGGGRGALHVDVLCHGAADAVAQLMQHRRAPGSAPADEHGNAGRRRVERGGDAASQRGAGSQHARSSRMGIRRPPRAAAASASG